MKSSAHRVVTSTYSLFAFVLFAVLSGCIAVHDGRGHHEDHGSCSVSCGKGSHAKVSCEKPRVPACQCEPEVAAACVSAQKEKTSFLM